MLPFRNSRSAGREERKLGRTLYRQQKHQEAEDMLRQAAQACGKTLGEDHSDTLDSKHWLAYTFRIQQKYREAEEMFRQAAQGREKALGEGHSNTLNSNRLLQEVLRPKPGGQITSFKIAHSSFSTYATAYNSPSSYATARSTLSSYATASAGSLSPKSNPSTQM